MSGQREYANCVECGQARTRHVLDERGVCPWCKLTVILCGSNPLLERK